MNVLIPQPWAHLIVTGQVDALPGCFRKPPRSWCGERVTIVAGPVDALTTMRLIERFPGLRWEQARPYEGTGVWVPVEKPRGTWNSKTTPAGTVRSWHPIPATTRLLWLRFASGPVGSVHLAGWLRWEPGARKPAEVYRAGQPGKDSATVKLHPSAHGPIAWVLRRPQLGGTPNPGQTIDPRTTAEGSP